MRQALGPGALQPLLLHEVSPMAKLMKEGSRVWTIIKTGGTLMMMMPWLQSSPYLKILFK